LFHHTHPYEPFLFSEATKLIVGTLPPPRFTKGILKDDDVNFCYGSRDGQLWRILDRIFSLGLIYENTPAAVLQRKKFLKARTIGICDIVASAKRVKIDASDLGMQEIELRDIVGYLRQYPKIDTLLFTGGNSKNGPEYFFRKHLKTYGSQLTVVADTIPRIHKFKLPLHAGQHQEISPLDLESRSIRTVSLTAPSGAANRAVGGMELYKRMKAKNPEFNTFDFRVLQYRPFF